MFSPDIYPAVAPLGEVMRARRGATAIATVAAVCALAAGCKPSGPPAPPSHVRTSQQRELELALVQEAPIEGAPSVVDYEGWHFVIGETRKFRVISADFEPSHRGDGVRVTFEPRDATQLSAWAESNVHRTFAWLRDGEIMVVRRFYDVRNADSWRLDLSWGPPGRADELVALLGATRNAALAKEYGEPLDAASWIELERMACDALCPAYTLRVSGDGAVTYSGRSGVAQTGEHRASIPPVATRRLFLRLAAADWLALPIGDGAPSGRTSVTLHTAAGTKRLASADSPLVEMLATAIDVETGARRWTGRLDAVPIAVDVRSEYAAPDPDAVEIIVQRSACYGDCPSYRLAIRGDGSVDYFGGMHVAVKGDANWTIARDSVEYLLARMEQVGFWQLRDAYYVGVTDIASTTITLRIGDRTKTVINSWIAIDRVKSRDLEIQRQLDDLARAIDAAVDAESWIEPR
ncbi:MAG: DUF6438 domain-containing protein [Planctomycetota bacterium]